MGVFARLLGRSKATQEVSAAEVQAGTEPDGAKAEETEPAEAKGAGPAEAEPSAEGGRPVATRSDAGTEQASENTAIPRQQSAEEAADSEAGEGARK